MSFILFIRTYYKKTQIHETILKIQNFEIFKTNLKIKNNESINHNVKVSKKFDVFIKKLLYLHMIFLCK